MIVFLLTNWWIYIPIILMLLFLIMRNNQKIQYIKRGRAIREADPIRRQQMLEDLKRKPSKFDKTASRYGLKGITTHIFPKK